MLLDLGMLYKIQVRQISNDQNCRMDNFSNTSFVTNDQDYSLYVVKLQNKFFSPMEQEQIAKLLTQLKAPRSTESAIQLEFQLTLFTFRHYRKIADPSNQYIESERLPSQKQDIEQDQEQNHVLIRKQYTHLYKKHFCLIYNRDKGEEPIVSNPEEEIVDKKKGLKQCTKTHELVEKWRKIRRGE